MTTTFNEIIHCVSVGPAGEVLRDLGKNIRSSARSKVNAVTYSLSEGFPISYQRREGAMGEQIHDLSYRIHSVTMLWRHIASILPVAFHRELVRDLIHQGAELTMPNQGHQTPLACKFFVEVHEAMAKSAQQAKSYRHYVEMMLSHMEYFIGQKTDFNHELGILQKLLQDELRKLEHA